MKYTIEMSRDEIEVAIRACRTYANVPLVPCKRTIDSRDLMKKLIVIKEEMRRSGK